MLTRPVSHRVHTIFETRGIYTAYLLDLNSGFSNLGCWACCAVSFSVNDLSVAFGKKHSSSSRASTPSGCNTNQAGAQKRLIYWGANSHLQLAAVRAFKSQSEYIFSNEMSRSTYTCFQPGGNFTRMTHGHNDTIMASPIFINSLASWVVSAKTCIRFTLAWWPTYPLSRQFIPSQEAQWLAGDPVQSQWTSIRYPHAGTLPAPEWTWCGWTAAAASHLCSWYTVARKSSSTNGWMRMKDDYWYCR